MSKPTELPGAFSVSEVAEYFKISRSQVLRNIHNAIYPAVVRVGNQVLILSPAFSELVARSLPVGDERRAVQEELDALLARDAAEAKRESDKQDAIGRYNTSAKGQSERAKREQAERDARYQARPEFGTALARTKVLRFGRGKPGDDQRVISDAQTTAEHIVGADPINAERAAGRKVGDGARKAYVLSDLTDLTDEPRTHTLADISGRDH